MPKTLSAPSSPAPVVAPLSPQAGRRGRAFRAIGALVLREMTTTFGNSPGGFLWAVVEPVAAIALLSLAFSLIFVAPPLGRDFALFYATGFIPFFLFLDVSQKVAAALTFSRPLLSFSGVSWVDALAARFALNTLTHLVIAALVLGGLFARAEGLPAPRADTLASAIAMAAALALGVGAINAYLTRAFPVWERTWSVCMRPMFIVSGVVFLFEDVPRNLQNWLAWNPLFHITGEMRRAFYPTYHPDYVDPVFVFALALILSVIGGCLLHRFHDTVLHK